jgi:hypothetical protein
MLRRGPLKRPFTLRAAFSIGEWRQSKQRLGSLSSIGLLQCDTKLTLGTSAAIDGSEPKDEAAPRHWRIWLMV